MLYKQDVKSALWLSLRRWMMMLQLFWQEMLPRKLKKTWNILAKSKLSLFVKHEQLITPNNHNNKRQVQIGPYGPSALVFHCYVLDLPLGRSKSGKSFSP